MVETSAAASRGKGHGRGSRSPGRGFLAFGLAWAFPVARLRTTCSAKACRTRRSSTAHPEAVLLEDHSRRRSGRRRVATVGPWRPGSPRARMSTRVAGLCPGPGWVARGSSSAHRGTPRRLAPALANGGVNPQTQERVVPNAVCHYALAVMATAGLYETSGDWLYGRRRAGQERHRRRHHRRLTRQGRPGRIRTAARHLRQQRQGTAGS
jgi:hypothetical protein